MMSSLEAGLTFLPGLCDGMIEDVSSNRFLSLHTVTLEVDNPSLCSCNLSIAVSLSC